MKEIIITRKQLYDLVWSEPISSLSKKYNLTDSELRAVCNKHSIPLPKNGFWQKVRFGKEVIIEELPISEADNEIKLYERDKDDEITKPTSPEAALLKNSESNAQLDFKVPLKLSNPDKLISIAKDSLNKRRSYGRDYGLINCSTGELDISVSEQNVMRALCFMDTLIKLLRARGHNIIFEYQDTCAAIHGENVKIRIREKTKRVVIKDRWEHSEYHPTGVLTFRMGNYSWHETEWKDGRQMLEEQLPKIIVRLELEAQKLKQEREERKRWQEEQSEKERVLRELEQRREGELFAFKSLLQDAERWRKVSLLRDYIKAIETRTVEENEEIPEERKNWLDWAKRKVNWYDPYVNLSDELLKDVDKETLTFRKKGSSWF